MRGIQRGRMSKKNPQARKKKGPPSPGERLAWHRRYMLSRQRDGFIGALRFFPGRHPKDTIVQVLHQCLHHRGCVPSITHEGFRQVLGREKISLEQFQTLCETYWPQSVPTGNQVHAILKAVGYQGSIDDLWLSVYGMWKPSIPSATVARDPKTGRRLAPGPWWSTGSTVVHTGQTRKPGSHQS